MFTSKNQPAKGDQKGGADDHQGHANTTANFGGHGHSQGSQGPDGHPMPANDHHLQKGSNVPQNFKKSDPGGDCPEDGGM